VFGCNDTTSMLERWPNVRVMGNDQVHTYKVDDAMSNKDRTPLVLGIETSCDETAAAVVAGDGRILSNVVLSQIDDHRPYGGVVPEIAARAHIDHLDRLIAEALAGAGVTVGDLDAVAATAGPGLIGGVIVGLMTGKAI